MRHNILQFVDPDEHIEYITRCITFILIKFLLITCKIIHRFHGYLYGLIDGRIRHKALAKTWLSWVESFMG